MAHPFHGLGQRLSQAQAAAAVAFEQLQGHALGGFLADTRQGAQSVDQLADQWAEAHVDRPASRGNRMNKGATTLRPLLPI
ncbi:hypothetical protein D3C79_958970 [compost metagenome]